MLPGGHAALFYVGHMFRSNATVRNDLTSQGALFDVCGFNSKNPENFRQNPKNPVEGTPTLLLHFW